jgi:hypothetical protein
MVIGVIGVVNAGRRLYLRAASAGGRLDALSNYP